MQKKYSLILLLLVFLVIVGCGIKNKNINKNNASYQQEQMSATENVNNTSIADGIYKIDMEKSQIYWTGKRVIGNAHHGTVKIKEGNIIFSNNNQLTSGEVIVDMTTISESQNNATNNTLVKHLSSEDFFDVAKYPEAKMVITNARVKENGKNSNKYQLTGNLAIKNISNPINFEALISYQKDTVTIDADLAIDRTKWNIKFGSNKFEQLSDKAIEDQIKFTVNIVSKKTQ